MVDDLDPPVVGKDDLFVPETSEIARGVYAGHGKDLRDIFLCQVNAPALFSKRIL